MYNHNFRKLKLPVKVYQALLVILLSLQQCTGSDSPLLCFNPVWKTQVFSVGSGGFVYANNKHQILSNKSGSHLYKISTTLKVKMRHAPYEEYRHAFYLFDIETRTFLCWKNINNGAMSAMSYEEVKKRNLWDQCKFYDTIPTDERYQQTHVVLQLAEHPNMTMQFDKKGRNVSFKRIQKCKEKLKNTMNTMKAKRRHLKRCRANNIFLLYYSAESGENCCGEAYRVLCKDKTFFMPELKEKCVLARSCDRKL
ncbi:hypothetical protein ABEB36_000945 [Hypothenemus hampei]|uniref:Uncharacterized protein n=1 Tax=Hypothenemus hampei TaxID=57062 RepID=A0ABD1FCZ4_HYPHA